MRFSRPESFYQIRFEDYGNLPAARRRSELDPGTDRELCLRISHIPFPAADTHISDERKKIMEFNTKRATFHGDSFVIQVSWLNPG